MSQEPKWREFEKLTALIEHHLGPQGAIVRSPDHVTDKITGQEREVDASVRYQVGSVPILITIECRDRTSAEDVTWIEQLIAKRDSIGASATIAVSSTGFSAPALEKAKAHGIEARILREVSEDAIRDWAQHLEIVVVRGTFGMGQLRVQFKQNADNQNPELAPEVVAEYAKGDIEYRFIRRAVDDEMISIGDLLREAQKAHGLDICSRRGTHLDGSLRTGSGMCVNVKTTLSGNSIPAGMDGLFGLVERAPNENGADAPSRLCIMSPGARGSL